MPASEYADYLEFACAVAIAAGAGILPHFRRSIDVEDKGGKADYDPVTEADRLAEAFIRGAIEQLVRDRRRLVVGARDLLDHDTALAIQLLGVEAGASDEIAQEVDRRHRGLRPARDVKGHEIVRRVGVQLRAQPLRRLVHVAVGGVLLAALEDQVLEEVRHPVLLGALGAGARVEGDQCRKRPRARNRKANYGKPIVKRYVRDVDHRRVRVLAGLTDLDATLEPCL